MKKSAKDDITSGIEGMSLIDQEERKEREKAERREKFDTMVVERL